MPIKKCVTALTAGSLVCLAVLGLRSQATAQHEKEGRGRIDHQGRCPVAPDQEGEARSKGG